VTVEPFLPGDVPEVPLGVAEGEAAEAVRRVERFLEHLRAVDALQHLVHEVDLLRGREVKSEREAAKAVGARAELRLVVLGGVEADDDPFVPWKTRCAGSLSRSSFQPRARRNSAIRSTSAHARVRKLS
jgi:hypothetical protein